MRRVNLSAGDTLFRKGEEAGEAYLIMEGTIQISSDALSVDLGKDELFGESGLVGNTRQADAIAKTNCQLMALSVDELRESVIKEPDTAMLLIGALIQRLADTLNKLEEVKRVVS